MAKEYFMPLFSVRASKSDEAYKQSLLMEQTHAINESETTIKTQQQQPQIQVQPHQPHSRKNNFVLVNSFPSPAGIAEENVENGDSSGNNTYGITQLFKRTSKKNEPNQQPSHHSGFKKLYQRSRKRKPTDPTSDSTTTTTASTTTTNFINYTPDKYDTGSCATTPASPPIQIPRNRSTSASSSSYFTFKHTDMDSFDTSYSTTPFEECVDDDILSIHTSNSISSKRHKLDRRSSSVVSLVSAVGESPVHTPVAGQHSVFPTLRSVKSRPRLNTQPTTPGANASIGLRSRSSSSVMLRTPTVSVVGMNLDTYLGSLEAQRVQNIVNEQQQQILKQQLHHNDPVIVGRGVQSTPLRTQSQIGLIQECVVEEEEDREDKDVLGLDLLDMQLGLDFAEVMDMELDNIDMDMKIPEDVDVADDFDEALVQELDQLINVARLEEYARECTDV